MKHFHWLKKLSPLSWSLLVVLGVAVFWLTGSFLSSSPPDGAPSLACESVNRSSYGIDEVVFSQLPYPPACLLSSSRAFQSRVVSDPFFFSHEYYLQPEFYPSFFTEGLSKFTSPTSSHYGAVGYGAFPHTVAFARDSSRSLVSRVFFHSGFGVRSYQVGRLDVEFAIPEDAAQVDVILDSDSRSGFVLGPSFPLFSSTWVKPVDVEVRLKPSAPYREIVVYLVTREASSGFVDGLPSPFPGVLYSFTDYVGSQRAVTLVIRPS